MGGITHLLMSRPAPNVSRLKTPDAKIVDHDRQDWAERDLVSSSGACRSWNNLHDPGRSELWRRSRPLSPQLLMCSPKVAGAWYGASAPYTGVLIEEINVL
jgi:hypothetical protein